MSLGIAFTTKPAMSPTEIEKMMRMIYKSSGVDPNDFSNDELFELGKMRGEFSVDPNDAKPVRKYLKRKRIKFTDNGYGGTEDMEVEQMVSRVVCGSNATEVLESVLGFR